jgi:hypothetical protein
MQPRLRPALIPSQEGYPILPQVRINQAVATMRRDVAGMRTRRDVPKDLLHASARGVSLAGRHTFSYDE